MYNYTLVQAKRPTGKAWMYLDDEDLSAKF